MANETKKDKTQKSKGLQSRMESFYFEITSPDGKTTKIGAPERRTKDK